MRQSTMGWLMMAVGIFAIMIELGYAQLYSGNTKIVSEMYKDGQLSAAQPVTISPEELPVRINFESTGVVHTRAASTSDHSLSLTVDFGDGLAPATEIIGLASNSLKRRTEYVTNYTSIMPEGRQPGEWNLSLDVAVGKKVELESVVMTVRTNARAVNIITIVFFATLSILGFAIAMMGHGKE